MENIKESGLSRVYQHVQKHDCGGITAYRTYKDKEKTIEFSRKEKQNRNKLLLSKLFKLGYDVTSVKGYYPEAGVDISEKEGKEESFFVVDSNDRGSLRKDLMNLGEDDDFGAENHLHQDSILFIPRGGKEAFLIGTNINTDIGYHEEIPLGEFVGGKAGVFYSRVNGRPFLLENVVIEYNRPTGQLGTLGTYKKIELLTKIVLQETKGSIIRLTKDSLVEGQIIPKGTSIKILK